MTISYLFREEYLMVCLLLAAVTICIYSSEHWLVFLRMLGGASFQGSALIRKSYLYEIVINTYFGKTDVSERLIGFWGLWVGFKKSHLFGKSDEHRFLLVNVILKNLFLQCIETFTKLFLALS